MSRRVAIVGGGYAGLAAAVELADHDIAVDIFEASRSLGGRARTVAIDGLMADNGAHILVGAYRETLRLMRRVGVPDAALLRLPLHLEFPGRFRLHAPRLPAPLHLAAAIAGAQGISWRDRLGIIRFMSRWQRRGFRLDQDDTVAALLAGQSANACRMLWEPLCLAALNTPAAEASARVFLNVLRDSLAGCRDASDLLLPATGLSELFPEPAAEFVSRHGGTIHRSCRIAGIRHDEQGFTLDQHGIYDQVVLAVAPQHLPALLAAMPELGTTIATLDDYAWQPIVTCYLRYQSGTRLPQPMLGVLDGTAQWLFDRGASHGQDGLIAAVISASQRHREIAPERLAAEIHSEISAILPGLPQPLWTRRIAEQRATYACTPGLVRPAAATAIRGLWLAGDFTAGDYPATIEGAVRSGITAASAVREHAARQA
jgi:squalene-associated FAD-dependent desaturase